MLNDIAPPPGIQRRYGRLVSLSLPCPGVSLMAFLRHARGQPRYFWESSREDIAFAGMGTALELMAWGAERFTTVERQARELFANALVLDGGEAMAAPRLFGGFAFRDDFVPDQAWADFTPAHLVLPHYQLLRLHETHWLTLNVQVPEGDDVRALVAELRAALQAKIAQLQLPAGPRTSSPATLQCLDYPQPFAQWAEAVEQVRARIATGTLSKAVLARAAEAVFATPIDVEQAVAHLIDAYPNTYRFLFEPRPARAFFGATPELLAGVQGRAVTTMALAGSVRRGATPAEDAELAAQLLASAKDRHEHQIVIDAIQARLAPRSIKLELGATEVMTLRNIQHLHTPISATLRQHEGILPLVAALHPTPALGGEPRDAATALIGALEPFPRGWYAAPVGWIDCRMDGQFGVGIRSAVMQATRAWLYAGAGIVAASDPQREWDETDLKFRPMLEALGVRRQEAGGRRQEAE